MTVAPSTNQRFRGQAASSASRHVGAAATVAVIAILGVVGVVGPVTALAFFAVGAGAGYSLSGSV